jgi:hypothetical protein
MCNFSGFFGDSFLHFFNNKKRAPKKRDIRKEIAHGDYAYRFAAGILGD